MLIQSHCSKGYFNHSMATYMDNAEIHKINLKVIPNLKLLSLSSGKTGRQTLHNYYGIFKVLM